MNLTTANVEKIFNACLAYQTPGKRSKKVHGILSEAIFDEPALATVEADINSMIDQLPDTFHQSGGGGMSFLNICLNKNGEQWADLHLVMEKLLLLGIAIDRMAFNLPKPLWSILPGGMPYVFIKNKELANDPQRT